MHKHLSVTVLTAALTICGLVGSWAALAQGPGGRGGRMEGRGFPNPLLQALDADNDGELSAKEIKNATSALEALDKNKDGKVTREEMMPQGFGRMGGGRGVPNQDASEMVTMLMAFDKNKDGKISKEELPERFKVLMDRADTNKDGFLDKTELTEFVGRQARPGRGPGGDGPDGPRRKRGGPGGNNAGNPADASFSS